MADKDKDKKKDKGPTKKEAEKMVRDSFKRNKSEDDHDTREADRRLQEELKKKNNGK